MLEPNWNSVKMCGKVKLKHVKLKGRVLRKHILIVTIGKYVEVAVPLRLHNRIAVFVAFSIAHHCMKSYAQCAQAFGIGHVCSPF